MKGQSECKPASFGTALQQHWALVSMKLMSFLSSSSVHGPFFSPIFSQQGCLPIFFLQNYFSLFVPDDRKSITSPPNPTDPITQIDEHTRTRTHTQKRYGEIGGLENKQASPHTYTYKINPKGEERREEGHSYNSFVSFSPRVDPTRRRHFQPSSPCFSRLLFLIFLPFLTLLSFKAKIKAQQNASIFIRGKEKRLNFFFWAQI